MKFDELESSAFTGPLLTHEMVQRAEAVLGRRLPREYVALLSERNGGVPEDRCFATDFPNSWSDDHIEILAIRGIGGPWGIENPKGGSAYLISEWGYPDIGIVICEMPSGGHDAVMLDYSAVDGASGEPSVVYIDEDRVPNLLAVSFGAFTSRLYSESMSA